MKIEKIGIISKMKVGETGLKAYTGLVMSDQFPSLHMNCR